MYVNYFNLKHQIISDLHLVIDAVGEKEISVAEGFDQIIRLLFSSKNYLPLDNESKFSWLVSIAEITYNAMHLTYCDEEQIDYFYDLLIEKCYPDIRY